MDLTRPSIGVGMKTSEIRKLVEHRVATKTRITKPFIYSLSPKLLKHCEDEAIRIYGDYKDTPWWSILFRVLYTKGTVRCSVCGTEALGWQGWDTGLGKYCSCKCAGADDTVKVKRASTCMEKYGVSAVQKVPSVRKKFKAAMIEKYGVEYTGQSKQLSRKTRRTVRERYGVEHTFSSDVVRQKSKQTMLDRYGVEHSLQHRPSLEKQQKSGFQIRKFTIKGKKFEVRGYEPQAIKFLVNQLKVNPKDILTTSAEGVPSIPWTDSAGVRHLYHPDIYAKVKGKWWIIEVKSEYTAGLCAARPYDFYRTRSKAQACISANFRFKLLVVNDTVNVINDLPSKSRKQLIRALK